MSKIITAGTDAHTIIVRIISHTAVIFSAISESGYFRYINFQDMDLENELVLGNISKT